MSRPGNGKGAGNTVLLSFNPDEPNDRLALQMARQLASERSLSAVMKGLLLALNEYQHRTGITLDASMVTGMFLSGVLLGHINIASSPQYSPVEAEEPLIVMSTAEAAAPEEIGRNFTRSMGNLFDDD